MVSEEAVGHARRSGGHPRGTLPAHLSRRREGRAPAHRCDGGAAPRPRGGAGRSAGGLYLTARRRWPRGHLATLCVAAILIGYSTYALVPLRSATDPPIDIGNLETTEALVSYLNRVQYGSTPLLSGRTFNDETGRVSRRGEPSLFPRRHSPDPKHWRVYEQYESDWDFFWDYQVGHMYGRYLMWNFAGKSSDTQNAPAWTGLPLLLGIFGAVYHFSRDERRALALLALILATGSASFSTLTRRRCSPAPATTRSLEISLPWGCGWASGPPALSNR